MDTREDGPTAAVRRALEREGPATCPELAARLDAHPATVRRACDWLQRQGQVRRTTGGAYALADSDPVRTRRASD